jgi:hypothetical protein
MSQCLEISRYLSQGKSVTSLVAVKLFGCLRLSERIRELRKKRWPIKSEWIQVGTKHVKRYWIPAARLRKRAR